MGRRGPVPEASALKLIKGNPGKRSVKKNQPRLPAPEIDESHPPKRLKGVAADEWIRLYGLLVDKGIVHVGNWAIFEEYCYVLGELRRIENLSKKLSADMAIMHGYFKAAANLRQQLRQLARDVKLTEYAGENIGGEKQESKLQKFIRPVG
jgi:phage terminase small subunit